MSHRQELDAPRPPHMPLFLKILAVSHLVGGGLFLAAIMARSSDLSRLQDLAEVFSTSPFVILANLLLLAILIVAPGIGMWLGRPWGWWLAVYYQVDSIIRTAKALLLTATYWDDAPAIGLTFGDVALGYTGRILSRVFVLLYLFRPYVREYFGISEQSPRTSLTKVVGVSFFIYAISIFADIIL